MPPTSQSDLEHVMEKTEQSLRILTACWDKRLELLGGYFKAKHSFWNLLRRSSPTVHQKLQSALGPLRATNDHEQAVMLVLKKQLPFAMKVIDTAVAKASSEKEITLSDDLKSDVVAIHALVERYQRYIGLHEDILVHESNVLAGDESEIVPYLKKIDAFLAELQALKDNPALRNRVQHYAATVDLIQKRRAVNSPSTYVEPSLYSAIFRVIGGNLTAMALLRKNPFDNPYFWELTLTTTLVIIVFNFTDYYFQWITKGTARFVKIRKGIAKELSGAN